MIDYLKSPFFSPFCGPSVGQGQLSSLIISPSSLSLHTETLYLTSPFKFHTDLHLLSLLPQFPNLPGNPALSYFLTWSPHQFLFLHRRISLHPLIQSHLHLQTHFPPERQRCLPCPPLWIIGDMQLWDYMLLLSQTRIEQNRCAMACQGCGIAIFCFL